MRAFVGGMIVLLFAAIGAAQAQPFGAPLVPIWQSPYGGVRSAREEMRDFWRSYHQARRVASQGRFRRPRCCAAPWMHRGGPCVSILAPVAKGCCLHPGDHRGGPCPRDTTPPRTRRHPSSFGPGSGAGFLSIPPGTLGHLPYPSQYETGY